MCLMKGCRVHFVFPSPRSVLLWAVLIVLCAAPLRAQKSGGGGGTVPRGSGGTGGGSRGSPGPGGPVYRYPRAEPGMQPDNSEIMFPTPEPFPKQSAVVNEDDACLPWDL